MDEETREKYLEAGSIAKKAREKARLLCEPGAEVEEIAEQAEAVIFEEGARPAFPINISVNEEAAHYTPSKDDSSQLAAGDVVKIDVGAHVDGYIGDTAVTVDLGDNDELVEAARASFEQALELAEAGRNVGEMGKAIQEAIESRGFKPVRNLGGHGLDRYTQHSGDRIPNIETSTGTTLEPGNAYAIEPFATDGQGKVFDGKRGNIYKYEGGNVRDRMARKILKRVKKNYKTLPFTSRWLDMSPARLKLAMRSLTDSGVVHSYNVLREKDDCLVSQYEHTILVFEDEVVVTTR